MELVPAKAVFPDCSPDWSGAALSATASEAEVRFYSFFIFATAGFMLATVFYIDSRRTARDRLWVLLTGLVLLVSHFAGVLALYAQGTAVVVAGNRKWRLRNVFAVAIGLSVLIFGLPLIPFFHSRLLYLYQVLGNGREADLSSTPLSLVNFAKLAFAGSTFVFGYHVYPGRLLLAIGGLALSGFLVGCGIVKLWRQPKWRAFSTKAGQANATFLLALIGVYFVLDSIGGRVAGGVAPRHRYLAGSGHLYVWGIAVAP